MRGFDVHGWAHDRSHSPTRVRAPHIDPSFDIYRSVRGSVFVSIDDLVISNGPYSPVAGTPPAFLNPL